MTSGSSFDNNMAVLWSGVV